MRKLISIKIALQWGWDQDMLRHMNFLCLCSSNGTKSDIELIPRTCQQIRAKFKIWMKNISPRYLLASSPENPSDIGHLAWIFRFFLNSDLFIFNHLLFLIRLLQVLGDRLENCKYHQMGLPATYTYNWINTKVYEYITYL